VLLATVFGIALATALGAWADHWLYGEWRPVAWNFFRVNLLEGKAAEFGVSPWWEYFRLLATQLMAPPWGILWLVVAALGFFQSKARPLLFSITPFFLIHCLISHKEFRFLYPLAGVLPLLLVLGSERFSLKSRMPWIRRWALGSWAKGANLLLLALFCLKPARYFTAVHLEIQRLSRQGPLCVYTADGLPAFFEHGIPMNFYRPSSVRTFQLPEGQEAEACRKLLYFRGYSDPGAIQRRYPGAKCIYRAFPEWLVQFNPFRWLERAQGAELWEILNTGGISKREE
jgi:phosphatidylinositol glycan class B